MGYVLKAEKLLLELEQLLEQNGYQIRKERGGFVGSDCLFEGDKLVIVNKNKPIFQNGDQLVITKNFGSVSTEGAIENPSIFNWEKGRRAKFYLSNSGGKLSKLGGKTYVVLSNGKTKRIGLFKNPRVFPDTKVIVNYKPEKKKREGEFLNNATNILGTLTGALTTILLLERL